MTKSDFWKLKEGDLVFYEGGNTKISLEPRKLYCVVKMKYNVIEEYIDVIETKSLKIIRISMEDALKYFKYFEPDSTEDDRVNHPSHYTWLKDKCGIEVLDITRHMNFNLGNAIKYILRSGHKCEKGMSNKQKQIEDLRKAIFCISDEIKKLE